MSEGNKKDEKSNSVMNRLIADPDLKVNIIAEGKYVDSTVTGQGKSKDHKDR